MRWLCCGTSLLVACVGPGRDPFAAGFERIAAPRKVSLRALAVVGEDVVWAAGSDDCVLRSTDGGSTWQEVGPEPEGFDFRSLLAFDADRAWIATAGTPARVLATTDGGASWRLLFEDPRPAAFFDAMAAWDESCAALFGDPVGEKPQIWITRDGGSQWQPVEPAAVPVFAAGEAGFAAGNSLLHAGPRGRLVAVTGGSRARCLIATGYGGSWFAVPLPLRQGTASQGGFAVAFEDENLGIAVGGDYRDAERSSGTVAHTRDGGRSWTAAPGGAGGYRSSVAFVAGMPGTAVAVGERGTSITRDGGRTWRPLGEQGFHAVRCSAGGTLFAVGGNGRIGRLRAPRAGDGGSG